MADSTYGYQPVNKCFTVPGSTAAGASYIKMYGFPGYNVSSAGYGYTVSMWLFPEDDTPVGGQEIWFTTSADNMLRFGADRRVSFVVQHSGAVYNTASFAIFSNSLTLNRWNHIAAYRGPAADHMAIFQDGTLVTSTPMPDWPRPWVSSYHYLNSTGTCRYKGGYGQFAILLGDRSWGSSYKYWNRYLNHQIINNEGFNVVLDLSDDVLSGSVINNRGIVTTQMSITVAGGNHTWPSSSPLHPSYYLYVPGGYQGFFTDANSEIRLNVPIESVSIDRSAANAFHPFEVGKAFIRTSTRSRGLFDATEGLIRPSLGLWLLCDYVNSQHCVFFGYPKSVKPKYQSATKDFGLTIELEEWSKWYTLREMPGPTYSVTQSCRIADRLWWVNAKATTALTSYVVDITSDSFAALRNWYSYPVPLKDHVNELLKVSNHWFMVRSSKVDAWNISNLNGSVIIRPFSYAVNGVATSIATYTNAFYSIDPFVENVDHYNTIFVRGIPRTYISTATSITALAVPIKIPKQTEVPLAFEYIDPGIEYSVPAALGTISPQSHWSTNTSSDGTGTDMTSVCSLRNDGGDNQTYASFFLYNSSTTSDCYLYRFVAPGNPYRQTGIISTQVVNSDSAGLYGTRKLTMESYLFQDAAYTQSYASYIGSNYGEPRYNVAITVKNDFPNCLRIQNGEIISLVHSELELNGKYIALKVTHDIDSDRGIEHTMRLELEKYA